MEISRPKGVLNFLVAYIVLVVFDMITLWVTEPISSVLLIGFFDILYIFAFGYGILFGYLGLQYKFLVLFCGLVVVSGLSQIAIEPDLSIVTARKLSWVLYCSALTIYLLKVKNHDFYKHAQP